MAIISPEQYFYVANGAVLKDLNETLSELKAMSSDTFSHHVNSDKNDFSNWVRDVLNDSKLASKLSSAQTQQDAIKAIEASLTVKPKKATSKKRDVISSIKKRISDGQ